MKIRIVHDDPSRVIRSYNARNISRRISLYYTYDRIYIYIRELCNVYRP